jgi:hypothetical protein
MNGNVGLLLPLSRHSNPDLCQEPVLEWLTSFKDTAADDQGIRVEGIHHFVEKKSQGVGLNPENFFAHGIALVRQATNEFGCLMPFLLGQVVARIALQKIRQKSLLNRGKRAERPNSPWQNYGKCASGEEVCGTGKMAPPAGESGD